MVHSQVEPKYKILLGEALTVEELGKIHRWIIHILAIVCVGGFRLRILSLRDMKIILGPVCGVDQITTVEDGQVGQAGVGQDPVATILAVVVGLVLVHHDDLGLGVKVPVEPAVVLVLDKGAGQLHRVAGAVARPGVGRRDGRVAHELHRVLRPQDIKVGLEVEDVVVHGAGEVIVDLVAVVLVLGKVGGLDVT